MQNARERSIVCESITPLDSEEDGCFLIVGDGYDAPRPEGDDDAHVWVPCDSAPAHFIRLLDATRETLFGRINRWGGRLRHIPNPDEEPPPEEGPSPPGENASWERSQLRDKKQEDTDLEGGSDAPPTIESPFIDEAQPDDEEEEEYEDDDDMEEYYEYVAPKRLIGKKWVILTITEYQLYKCFMSLRTNEAIFFRSVARYLKGHNGQEPVDMGTFEDWVAQSMGDQPNGIATPAQPLHLDQIGRLERIYRRTTPSATAVYNTMSTVCALSNRVCEEVDMGAAGIMRGDKIEVPHTLLKQLFDQSEKLKQLQKDMFELSRED